MTTEQFVAKYNGKPVDFDGRYGMQCMDLVAQFVQEVWGHSGWDIAKGFAYQVWTEFGTLPVSKYAHLVPNTPTGVPPEGAIMVWGTGIGQAGHISIVRGGSNANTFNSFDQNWNYHQYCEPVTHNYSNVFGWIVLNDTPKPQGDIMITDGDRDPIRVISSEVKGWDFNAVHQGVWDAREVNAWKGRPWRDFIMQGWNEGAAFRNERERNRIFYQQYASVIADLPNRPTKAQLDEALAKLADEAKKVEKANAEAEAARKKLAEAEANKSEDTILLDQSGTWLKQLWDRLFKKGDK